MSARDALNNPTGKLAPIRRPARSPSGGLGGLVHNDGTAWGTPGLVPGAPADRLVSCAQVPQRARRRRPHGGDPQRFLSREGVENRQRVVAPRRGLRGACATHRAFGADNAANPTSRRNVAGDECRKRCRVGGVATAACCPREVPGRHVGTIPWVVGQFDAGIAIEPAPTWLLSGLRRPTTTGAPRRRLLPRLKNHTRWAAAHVGTCKSSGRDPRGELAERAGRPCAAPQGAPRAPRPVLILRLPREACQG